MDHAQRIKVGTELWILWFNSLYKVPEHMCGHQTTPWPVWWPFVFPQRPKAPFKKFATKSADGESEKKKSQRATSVSSLVCDNLVVNVFFLVCLHRSVNHMITGVSHESFSWGCLSMGLVRLIFGPECTGRGLSPEPCTLSYWHTCSSASLPSRALTREVCMSRQMGHR